MITLQIFSLSDMAKPLETKPKKDIQYFKNLEHIPQKSDSQWMDTNLTKDYVVKDEMTIIA